MGHSSVTTAEEYAKFSLGRLEMNFPSLKNNSNREKRKSGHGFDGHKPIVNPLSANIVCT